MVKSVFSITTFNRPSRMAGVRQSIRLRSHSYSCSVMDRASAWALRFLSAQPRMICARGAMRDSMAPSGMIGAGAEGAKRAPDAAMPGIGNRANFAFSSTAAGSMRCVTPGMPPSGHGNPWARTRAPAAATRRAISCSRRSPPSMPMRRLFQSICGFSGAMRSCSNQTQQGLAIEPRNAHALRGPAGRCRIEPDQHLPYPQKGSCERYIHACDLCQNRKGQKSVADILLIVPVPQRIRRSDRAVGYAGRDGSCEVIEFRYRGLHGSDRLHLRRERRQTMIERGSHRPALVVERAHDLRHPRSHSFDIEGKGPLRCLDPGGAQNCARDVEHHIHVGKIAREHVKHQPRGREKSDGASGSFFATRQSSQPYTLSLPGDGHATRLVLACHIGERREFCDRRWGAPQSEEGLPNFERAAGMPGIEQNWNVRPDLRQPSRNPFVRKRRRADRHQFRVGGCFFEIGGNDGGRREAGAEDALEGNAALVPKWRECLGGATPEPHLVACFNQLDYCGRAPRAPASDRDLHACLLWLPHESNGIEESSDHETNSSRTTASLAKSQRHQETCRFVGYSSKPWGRRV